VALSVGCSELPNAPPEPGLKAQDYATARQEFRTKLVRRGPSPQPVDDVARVPARVRLLTYTSGDLELACYVDDEPVGGAKLPAVLFLHGGCAMGGDDLEMPQPYRDAGFIVMVPVLRGENGQPGIFTGFYDEVDDVLAAANALADLPYVDDKRLYLAGHSAGGTLAMLAAMASQRFRAAAPISGSCNNMNRDEWLTPFDTSDIRESEMRSPVVYASSFKCPVRIYYGHQELWAVSDSGTTAARAKQAGLDVEVNVVPGDHMSCVPEAMRRSIEFFRQQQ
jgi:dienelactone hydrolase